jgi:hypothetical protein
VTILALMLLCSSVVVMAHPGSGIVCTREGDILFCNAPSHRVWCVAPDGTARVLVAGALDRAFRAPHHLVLAGRELYTASDQGGIVWRLGLDGALTKVLPPDTPLPGAIAIGTGGDPFTIDARGGFIAAAPTGPDSQRLFRVDRNGAATLLAGGAAGHADGPGAEARFTNLHGSSFAWGQDGLLYLTDHGQRVRRVTSDGTVTTIAGTSRRGVVDGPALQAEFQSAMGLAVAADGSVFVADAEARCIRVVRPDGIVATRAGTRQRGGEDGPALAASFDEPVGLTIDRDGDLLVLEHARADGRSIVRIRRVTLTGAGRVTTVACIPDP